MFLYGYTMPIYTDNIVYTNTCINSCVAKTRWHLTKNYFMCLMFLVLMVI